MCAKTSDHEPIVYLVEIVSRDLTQSYGYLCFRKQSGLSAVQINLLGEKI